MKCAQTSEDCWMTQGRLRCQRSRAWTHAGAWWQTYNIIVWTLKQAPDELFPLHPATGSSWLSTQTAWTTPGSWVSTRGHTRIRLGADTWPITTQQNIWWTFKILRIGVEDEECSLFSVHRSWSRIPITVQVRWWDTSWVHCVSWWESLGVHCVNCWESPRVHCVSWWESLGVHCVSWWESPGVHCVSWWESLGVHCVSWWESPVSVPIVGERHCVSWPESQRPYASSDQSAVRLAQNFTLGCSTHAQSGPTGP